MAAKNYLGIELFLSSSKKEFNIFHFNEFWKDVPGYEGLYFASTRGRIMSNDKFSIRKRDKGRLLRGRIIMKQTKANDGYMVVTLFKNKKGNRFNSHVLIAKTFIDNPDNKPCVNHENLNKSFNWIQNLSWCSFSENSLHAFNKGVLTGCFKPGDNGKTVKCIRTGHTFLSISLASKHVGISSKRLAHMLSGRCLNKSTLIYN